jgi:predicted enzyme related to lactoylglutathione lyase
MADALNWFEIPVNDFGRAKKFYEEIFGFELTTMEMSDGFPMGMFPSEEGVGGAIIQGEGYTPSGTGTIVYLNAGDDLSNVLNKVEAVGGKVLMPKTDIGENGFAAFFRDSEGNRVGLHSMG